MAAGYSEVGIFIFLIFLATRTVIASISATIWSGSSLRAPASFSKQRLVIEPWKVVN